MHGKMRTALQNLVRNPEGKRPLGICRHTWENYIRMDSVQ